MDFFYQYPIFIGLVSLLLAWGAMPIVLRIAKDKGLVVRPNKRTSHTGEVPNIGGLGICFAFLMTYMIFDFDQLPQARFLMIGLFAIVVVGLVDDILVLSPLSKLVCELLSGIAMIGFADIRLSHLHGLFGLTDAIGLVPSYCLSFFILIAVINAINLIDGVDGLASGLGIIYCLFFAIYFTLVEDKAWAILAIGLIGPLLVFFFYNVFGGHRRKIFMGDSGSLVLGYMLTAFVFHFCELNASTEMPAIFQMSAAPAVAICVLGVPLFDTIRVSVTRIKHHKSPFLPDKNHIHHLLLRTGLNHLETTSVLLIVSLLSIGLGIIGRNWNIWVLAIADGALLSLLTWILWRVLDYQAKKKQVHGNR